MFHAEVFSRISFHAEVYFTQRFISRRDLFHAGRAGEQRVHAEGRLIHAKDFGSRKARKGAKRDLEFIEVKS